MGLCFVFIFRANVIVNILPEANKEIRSAQGAIGQTRSKCGRGGATIRLAPDGDISVSNAFTDTASSGHRYLHNVGSTLNARKIGLLWRAGLSRVGLRSSPSQEERGVSDTLQRLVLGLLRSPTRDKPARHREICQGLKSCVDTHAHRGQAPSHILNCEHIQVWEGACPRWLSQACRLAYIRHSANNASKFGSRSLAFRNTTPICCCSRYRACSGISFTRFS